MNIDKDPLQKSGNPNEAYREEMDNRGSIFGETAAESDARDKAKIEKSLTGQTQKIDGGNPDEMEDDGDLAEEIRRETLEKK
jgi:hypothetical protein